MKKKLYSIIVCVYLCIDSVLSIIYAHFEELQVFIKFLLLIAPCTIACFSLYYIVKKILLREMDAEKSPVIYDIIFLFLMVLLTYTKYQLYS